MKVLYIYKFYYSDLLVHCEMYIVFTGMDFMGTIWSQVVNEVHDEVQV